MSFAADDTKVPVNNDNIAKFYLEGDPDLSEQCKAILTQYSGVPENELVSHVRQIRERLWKIYRYPCIGWYAFLDFSIGNYPFYADVVEKIKEGATLLDLGCCVGQDIRKLVFDGAPARNLTGSELCPDFIDVGYDLFRDRDRLEATFTTGDFFAPEMAGLVEHSFDYIHASSFFHLFNLERQFEAMSRCVRLLKRKPGSLIFGRQVGTTAAGEVEHAQTELVKTYRHDEASFRRLVDDVAAKTGVILDVKSTFAEERRVSGPVIPGINMWLRQDFVITITGVNP
ncbi:hypothetical protein CKM354_000899300 [Cercospora kikuchii]|uniref:Methyltransferase domain-containing protein n=1 Tax=Cercospora kikuchii TaxID=84275 RepID=A0A9P3FFS6_9PEZI|nr:uncharacterized protein CKM354_000899300 [Cercospora kikuchii]GIZ45843.1 hypothetical protein CKM354_000899300 [Cercospora kikuchii]